MKCRLCDKDFMSLEWYKEGIRDFPICDECLLEILKARKYIKQSEINSIDFHIQKLQMKIINKLS